MYGIDLKITILCGGEKNLPFGELPSDVDFDFEKKKILGNVALSLVNHFIDDTPAIRGRYWSWSYLARIAI